MDTDKTAHEKTAVAFIGIIIVAAVILVLILRKKGNPTVAPSAPTRVIQTQANLDLQRARSRQQQVQMINRNQGDNMREGAISRGGIQNAYQGTGYLPPNTYSYTVIQPKYKVSMGSVFDSLQPIHSRTAEFAGHFSEMNPRC